MSPDSDRSKLHPQMRARTAALDAAIEAEGLPMRLYEGHRSAFRQAWLFAQGRAPGVGTPGRYVTKARPWTAAMHPYGLAGDWLFRRPNGGWTWDEPEPGAWDRYTQLVVGVGLEPLSFERPHAQLVLSTLGCSLADLATGEILPGADASYLAALHQDVVAWGPAPRVLYTLAFPGAPPWRGPEPVCDRPPLAV